ncbi:MAG: single-stranded-DNA-specific exonuclease RecJ [Xanthomonadales bacterium]|nr:single-stranded-DNA-specific exonuclease RecJ [Xanthomonadales bacterium]
MEIVRRTLPSDPPELDARLHPVLRRILAARGITDMTQLDYAMGGMLRPSGLGDLDSAARRLARAVAEGERTLIVGDFDADGATGTALLVGALRAMGHPNVDFVVPNRFDFGYGLSPRLVRHIAEQDQPELLVTVDNGISSVTGVAEARSSGIEVIITDHHLPGADLPDASAIVNPNLRGAEFPSKALAGVGVAFYVLAATRAELARTGHFRAGRRAPNLGQFVDLVALGTVADLVPLDRNNRILVAQGLRRIRRNECRPGIRALLDVAGRDVGRVSATDLAFFVAPRLNAAGRLDDMSVGIRCLLTDDPAEARSLAAELDALNRDRRRIQEDMEQDALTDLEEIDSEDAVVCLFQPGWHQGVVGLVASRVKEKLHRPVLAFAPDRPGSATLKGSARSIPGFHIRDALAAVEALHPGLIDRFGGHAMAAGLSLDQANLPAFREAIQAYGQEHLSDDMLANRIQTDGELAAEDLSVDLALALREWGPWGQGFPEPTFDGWFDILDRRPIGTGHCKLRVAPRGTRRAIDALVFYRLPDEFEGSGPVRLVYQLEVNESLGQVTPQLLVRQVL